MSKREKMLFSIIIVLIAIIILLIFFSSRFKTNESSNENPVPFLNVESSKDCEFKKINQLLKINNQDYRVDDTPFGSFVVPENIAYSEVEFFRIGVLAKTFGDPEIAVIGKGIIAEQPEMRFYLNDVDCGEIKTQESLILNDLSDTCLSELREGINTFMVSDNVFVEDILIEMQIVPANC